MDRRWQQIQRIFCFFILCLGLSGCAASGPTVSLDKSQDFKEIDSFFVKSPLNSVNPTLENSIAQDITSALSEKGLSSTTENLADVVVSFFPYTETKEGGAQLNIGLGTGTFGRSGAIMLGGVLSVPVGEQFSDYQNLQIEVINKSTVIYSASGSIEIESNDVIALQQALNQLVLSLLDSYPSIKDK
jgi:hypothetical protein